MTPVFHSFLEAFAKSVGVEWSEGLHEGEASLDINGYPLNLLYFEGGNMLMAMGIVALLPEEKDERAAFMRRLLEMNNGFTGTGGGCLGVDVQEDSVTFQIAWPFDGMTQEKFDAFVINTVSLATRIMQDLAREDKGGDSDSSTGQASLSREAIRG